jgi:hypothetical protein
MTTMTYFIEITKMSDPKMSARIPRIFAGVTGIPIEFTEAFPQGI